MKHIKQISIKILGITLLMASLLTPLVIAVPGASAIDCKTASECATKGSNATGQSNSPDLMSTVRRIINVLLFIVGAIAVIMIIVGGIRYTLSGGDASQTTSAKNTILYAVVGLVVAVLAYAIVAFVLNSLR